MPQYDFLQPEATEEFRETEKAMTKPEYPQVGPPYDKTTYMGRIRDKLDCADNEFAKSSRDYRSVLNEMEDEVRKWWSLANDAISLLGGSEDKKRIQKRLINTRRAYLK